MARAPSGDVLSTLTNVPMTANQQRPYNENMALEIPIIDISSFISNSGQGADAAAIVSQVRSACENVGFFIITGHGIDRGMLDAHWEETRKWFDHPIEVKSECPMTKDYVYGYSGFGEEVLSRSLSKTENIPDLKESFCIGPDHAAAPPRRWDSHSPAFKETMSAYYNSVNGLADTLLEIIAMGLGLPPAYFKEFTDKHMSALRSLNYPAQTVPPKPGQLRASAHTDYGSITILRQDDVGGLQVMLQSGEWFDVATPPYSFVVNLGDLLQRWTNDRFISTIHRVANPPAEKALLRRQSVAFFHNVNSETVIEALPTCREPFEAKSSSSLFLKKLKEENGGYPSTTAQEHLMSKHKAAMDY
jgi:isopenicillin N synthase-like dioxygenase